MTETQPEDLVGFLAAAEYVILQAPKGTEGASESLIAAGCWAAPRLFAAVQAALKHHQPGTQSIPICTCGLTYPCYEVRDIMGALLGKGE